MNPKVQETSLEAYKKLRDSGRLTNMQGAVLAMFSYWHDRSKLFSTDAGLTYKDLERNAYLKSAQKRINELEKMGLIKKVGRRDGCSTYQYVPDPAEQQARAKYFAERKPEIERYTAWLHSQKLTPHGESWHGKVGDKWGHYSNTQLVKAFRQYEKLSDQIIF